MTQADLGAAVGEPPSSISRLQRDQKDPDPQLIAALADALDVLESFFAQPLAERFERHEWKVSVGAILHRAGQLGLLGAAAQRKLYRQYYWRGWHKGEPYEPKLEQPELLRIALRVAREDTGLEIAHLADRLGWKPSFFEEVTGIAVPEPPLRDNITSLEVYRTRQAIGMPREVE